MNSLIIILCVLMEATVIIAETTRLTTHSPHVNQDKLAQVDFNYVGTDQKILEIPGGYNHTDNKTIITVERGPLLLKEKIRSSIRRLNDTREHSIGNKIAIAPIAIASTTLPPLLRYYLPSKSLYNYNIDTGIQAQ